MVFLKKPKVLFIEEAGKKGKGLSKSLLDKGFEVVVAKSIDEGNQLIGLHNFDLILSELPKPQSDVFSFCKAQFERCPVIFYTTDKNKKYDDQVSCIGDLIVKQSEVEKKLPVLTQQVIEQRKRERLAAA